MAQGLARELFYFSGNTHTVDMAQTNIQTTDYLYPTTNTPPLTTHHTLIVCEAVRRVCPCGNDRDAKEGDCEDVSTSDQFNWKQLWNAAIEVLRRQKPSTNALDGLYLKFVDHMLEAWWVDCCDESVPGRSCVWRKSCWGLPFTHDGEGFHPTGRCCYIICLYQGGAILNPLP